ncbi:MmcQ/YjbR family DNA-binding protein [Neptunomonas antarctica]|uniref:Predicted DNA-binding protein, MmcQ/YjbR family n=1 Tax=Neptunomonas antarctica TaxID=619304 RepID=A0A1N7P1A3_9GAMM|nr:MmcQ/YjbR family DNA-binding protein [Neptunomonas antarctica]SIT04353.1 Predicted DNA-binding protein, MmcQ/YjbR family [Neptunomonas antarctica]
MNKQLLLQYLHNKPESQEDYPFGPDVVVFKVKRKMFALVSEYKNQLIINLKSDPQDAIELRDIFESVIPGYHMNKRHWNTLFMDGSIPEGEIMRQIDYSYALVVKGLTKLEKMALELSYGKSVIYKGLRYR